MIFQYFSHIFKRPLLEVMHNENFGCSNSESSELSNFGRFFRTFVGQSRIQYLQKMIKGHSVCHKIEVDDSLPGPNFHFLVFKYHANYHRPQSYGSAWEVDFEPLHGPQDVLSQFL